MILSEPLAVVTPTVDGDVLRALALADASFTTGQLHRLIGAHSVDGVRRVLRRLAEQGVVTAEAAGPSYLYRLNRQHLAAGPIEALARLRATLIERLRAELAAWDCPPRYAALFGSAARGDMRLDSDLDILLIRPSGSESSGWEGQVRDLAARAAAWTGNDARALEYDEDVVLTSRRARQVLETVRDEGIALAGDPAWLRRALAAPARA